jgi:hypothetical protein
VLPSKVKLIKKVSSGCQHFVCRALPIFVNQLPAHFRGRLRPDCLGHFETVAYSCSHRLVLQEQNFASLQFGNRKGVSGGIKKFHFDGVRRKDFDHCANMPGSQAVRQLIDRFFVIGPFGIDWSLGFCHWTFSPAD